LDGGFVSRLTARLRRTSVAASWWSRFILVEFGVFGPLWGNLLRKSATRVHRRTLAEVESRFDPTFYQRQLDDRRRRRVRHAPLLHYMLWGWGEDRAPFPDLDPVFYRRTHGGLELLDNPLLHYASVGASSLLARNEIEGQSFSRRWQEANPTVLTINHGRGGGSSQFLDIFERDLWQQGVNVLRLRAVQGSPSMGVIGDWPRGEKTRSVAFDLKTDLPDLAEFCRARGVTRLVVNHLIDRPKAMMDWIRELGRTLNCPYDVVLHDYYALCPRLDMIDGNGRFCGIAPPEVCVECVRRDGSDAFDVDPLTWRSRNLAFLAEARTVYVPSEDMLSRMSPYLPKVPQLWPPESDPALPPERRPSVARQAPLRVAVIGALNVPKGLKVVASLAEAAARARAPLEVIVVGPVSDDAMLTRWGVRVVGPYAPQNVDNLIDGVAPDVIFLPAVWPETWSFVLTIALRRGLPVVAFDIGAPAARLCRLARGTILGLELAERPADLLAEFLKLRSRYLDPQGTVV
jgi:glycosyltransferase involved in cell wall biosynthesis